VVNGKTVDFIISRKYMFGGQNSGTAFGKIVRVPAWYEVVRNARFAP